jgi:hypothetical protein
MRVIQDEEMVHKPLDEFFLNTNNEERAYALWLLVREDNTAAE